MSIQERATPETAAPTGNPTCTVIVCTRNRPERLRECLSALERQRYRPFRILVVDNASDNDATEKLARASGAQYLYSPEIGLSVARNHGGATATTDLVAYIDDDAIADAGWLEALVEAFREPGVVAVAGQTLPLACESAEKQVVDRAAASANERHQVWVVDRTTPDWFAMTNFGGIGDGNNMAFRRSLFEQGPLFLPTLGRGAAIDAGEEHFAFFLLVRSGLRVAYTPKAVVHHRIPESLGEFGARYRQALANSTAYMSLLFFEASGHRTSVLKYLLAFLRRSHRPWRPVRLPLAAPAVSPWQAMRALLRGPRIYLNARRKMKARLSQAAWSPKSALSETRLR